MLKVNLQRMAIIMTVAALSFLTPHITFAQSHNIDMYATLVANVANRLGLTGAAAGDFAATIIKQQGYRGYEAGKIAGQIAHVTGASGKETEQILAVVLNELNPPPEEAEQIAATVEVETGEKVSVVRDVGEVEVPKVRKIEEEKIENPLEEMYTNVAYIDVPESVAPFRALEDFNRNAEDLQTRSKTAESQFVLPPAGVQAVSSLVGSPVHDNRPDGSTNFIIVKDRLDGTHLIQVRLHDANDNDAGPALLVATLDDDGNLNAPPPRALTKEEALARIIEELFGIDIAAGTDLSAIIAALGQENIEEALLTSPSLYQ